MTDPFYAGKREIELTLVQISELLKPWEDMMAKPKLLEQETGQCVELHKQISSSIASVKMCALS